MTNKRVRANGEGTTYQRSTDGRWFYSRTIWVGTERHRRTVSAATKAALMPKRRALDKALAAGVMGDGSMTVADWLNYWHAEVAPLTARERTLDGYRSYIDTWLIPHLGAHRLNALTSAHVRGLWAVMGKAGKSWATMRQADAILSRALRIAVEDGKIERNVCTLAAATPPVGSKGSHGKLTTEEARKVIAAASGRSDRARWYAAILLGIRQGEALGLHWRDVDLDDGWIHIRESQARIKGKGLKVGPVKSDASDRIIQIGALPEVIVALRSMPEPHTGLVWGPKDNKRDWRDWREVLDLAGVPPRSLHSARATTASVLSELGVPAGTIAEILGHSDKRVTEDHYIHGDAGTRGVALGRLGAELMPQLTDGEGG